MANHEKPAPNIPDMFAEEDMVLASVRPTEEESFKNTLAFLSEYTASPDTKTRIPKKSQGQNLQQWEHALRILGLYFGTDMTNKEIADELEVTSANVNSIIKNGIRRLHKSASWKLKAKYPLESLSSHKPLTLASRRRISEAGGGLAVRVEQMASQGKTPAEIRQNVGGSERLGNARKTLSGWGIDIPLEKSPILPAFKELLNTELLDKDIQALLDIVQNYRRYRVLLKAGLIVNLTSLAKGAGLHLRGQDIPCISKVLWEEKIPQGKVPLYVKGEDGKRRIRGWYYFIAATLVPKASSILKETPKLQDLMVNPVRVIGAPVETIPNTTDLMRRASRYRSVLKLAEEIAGRKVSSSQLNRHNIVDGVGSVSFYTTESRGRLWYEMKCEDAVKQHLAKRMKELGIT